MRAALWAILAFIFNGGHSGGHVLPRSCPQARRASYRADYQSTRRSRYSQETTQLKRMIDLTR